MADASEPFRYPKSVHLRRLKPGPYTSYRTYKPHLAREFDGQCVYCRSPDSLKGTDTFGVDHYRPIKRFPALACDYANLFYACNRCNSRKGAYWPVGVEPRLPNPCDDEMAKHVWYDGPVVVSKSPAGALAEKLLDLNAPDLVVYRTDILELVRLARQSLNEIAAQRAGAIGAMLTALDAKEAMASSVLRRLGVRA